MRKSYGACVRGRLELGGVNPHNRSDRHALASSSRQRMTSGKKHVRHVMKAAAALAAMLASAPAIAGWEPTKPVEIVVAAGAGGASDQMARMMQAAIQKNNLMKQPMVVSLKGGASGRRSADVHEVQRRRPQQGADRLFADLHAAAVGEDSVQLARTDAGVGGRARPVRAVGQCSRAEDGEGIHRRRQGRQLRRSRWAAPDRSARTTC